MLYTFFNIKRLNRCIRWVLALFLLSVLNISMQLPAHALMKVQMEQAIMHDSVDCHCPAALCDSVLALDNQSIDGVATLGLLNTRSSRVIEIISHDSSWLNQVQQTEHLFLTVSLGAPPPLLTKTLLLI